MTDVRTRKTTRQNSMALSVSTMGGWKPKKTPFELMTTRRKRIEFVDDDGIRKAVSADGWGYGGGVGSGRKVVARISDLVVELHEEGGVHWLLVSYRPAKVPGSGFKTPWRSAGNNQQRARVEFALVDRNNAALRSGRFDLRFDCKESGNPRSSSEPIAEGSPSPRDVFRRSVAVELAATTKMIWERC